MAFTLELIRRRELEGSREGEDQPSTQILDGARNFKLTHYWQILLLCDQYYSPAIRVGSGHANASAARASFKLCVAPQLHTGRELGAL